LIGAQRILFALAFIADIAVLFHGRLRLAALYVGILGPRRIRHRVASLGRRKIAARRDHKRRPFPIVDVRLAVALEAKSVHDATHDFLVERRFVVGCAYGY
jgi:hypothetical protein